MAIHLTREEKNKIRIERALNQMAGVMTPLAVEVVEEASARGQRGPERVHENWKSRIRS